MFNKLRSAYGTNKKVRECMRFAYIHFKINYKNYDFDYGWSMESTRIATEETDVTSASKYLHLTRLLFEEWRDELDEGITSVEVFKGTKKLYKLKSKQELVKIIKTKCIHEQLNRTLNSIKESIKSRKAVLPEEFSEFKIYKYNDKLLLTTKVPDYIDNQTTVEAFLRETIPIPENCNLNNFIDEHITSDNIITKGSPVTEVVNRKGMKAYRIRVYNMPGHYNPAVSQFIYIPKIKTLREEEY